MSRTSQWEMSLPKIGRSRAPNGFTSSRNAQATSGSSASQPKKKLGTKRSLRSAAFVIPTAANSSTLAGRAAGRPK